MPRFYSAVLLSASAAAQITTTSIWLPDISDEGHVGFYGSVVAKDGDTTTIAIAMDNDTNTSYLGYYDNLPAMVTIHGETAFEAATTYTNLMKDAPITVTMGCSHGTGNSATAQCSQTVDSEKLWDFYCSDMIGTLTTTVEYTYVSDSSSYTETSTETYSPEENAMDFCLSGSTVPETIRTQTYNLEPGEINTYQLAITAGAEKLEASAGSTPTSSGASATATGSSAASGQSGATGTAASAPSETGAAVPKAAAPVLAGLGAAVAAFML